MSRNRSRKRGGGGGMPTPTYVVPKDTQDAIRSGGGVQKCDNLSLILNRYVPQQAIRNESFKEGRKDKKYQSEWLMQLVRAYTSNRLRAIQQGVYERWLLTTEGADRFEMELDERLVMGLGGGSVLETGITLRRNTGLPTLPGSALKGVARTHAVYTLAQKLHIPPLAPLERASGQKRLTLLDNLLGASDEETAIPILDDLNQQLDTPLTLDLFEEEEVQLFRLAFGTHGKNAVAGACVFFEAVVTDMPDQPFEIDVMTPHFPDYYGNGGQEPPTDDQQPIPVQFITVASGTRFEFAVGLRRDLQDAKQEQYAPVQDYAVGSLRKALTQLGIGGKTAAGYGFFKGVR